MGSTSLHLTAFAAIILTAVSTAFLLLFAVNSMVNGSPMRQVCVAGAALNAFDLVWICGLLFSFQISSRFRLHWSIMAVTASILVLIAAATTSMLALVWIRLHLHDYKSHELGTHPTTILYTAIGVCAASIIAQLVFVALFITRVFARLISEEDDTNKITATTMITTGTLKPALSPTKSSHPTAPSEQMEMSTPTKDGATQRSQAPPSPDDTLSANGTGGSPEFRGASLDGPPRLSNSSTRPSTPPQRQRLEPIPGSRPNSPGKPLEGPFSEEPDPEGPFRPRPPSLATSINSDRADESRVPPRFRKDSSSSYPTSPIIDESHIHPLFRSDSPHPPPSATAGTSVIASPVAASTCLLAPSAAQAHAAALRHRQATHPPRYAAVRTRRAARRADLSIEAVVRRN